jgi:hypothetical protein
MTIPKRYDISTLLLNGAQPYKNLDTETREYLAHTISSHGKKLNKMPVLLSADGILYDGHQRLMILAELGRKQIAVGEFLINPKVIGREAAYFEAVKTNQNRRHLTGKAKAEAMWEMVREFKLSQTTIAKRLGMRQQSVSELMRKYRPADIADMPTERIGADGRTINVSNIGKGIGEDITARDDVPTPYDYRQRIKKGLVQIAGKVSHLSTDAQMCGEFSTYAERDGVITAIDGIIGTLGAVRDKFTAPGGDPV